MKIILKIALCSVCLMSSISAHAFESEDVCKDSKEIKVVKVTGSGAGCAGDPNVEGESNWFWTFLEGKKILNVTFDKFRLTKRRSNKSCNLAIKVCFPEGKTVYAYASRVYGFAKVAPKEVIKVKTRVNLPSHDSGQLTKTLTHKNHGQGEWESSIEDVKGEQEAPCGGDSFMMEFDISLDRKNGTKSQAEVNKKEGKYDVSIDLREGSKC